MKLNFVKMGINGEGIGYENRRPVFCDGVLPGETAIIDIEEDHDTYLKAKCRKRLKSSADRVRSACRYQSDCGGCPLLIMSYDAQLKAKRELLKEALYKYGNVREHFIRDIRGSQKTLGYRSACKLPVREVNGELYSGMYKPNSNHFIPVGRCLMHDEQLEASRRKIMKVLDKAGIKAYDAASRKGLRYLVMRCAGGHIQCTLVSGKDTYSGELIAEIMKAGHLDSLFQSVNTSRRSPDIFGPKTRCLAGSKTIPLTIGGITLQLSPQAFFQLNIDQAEKMYETAVSKIDPCGVLVEAYCGIGAMSLMSHQKAERIVGIENVPDAIRDAKANAEANNIRNVEFICDDAAEGLLKTAMKTEIDTVLADPPRSGMDQAMISALLSVHPRKIIYVSCNPATLARNLKDLKRAYHVVTVIPFDLFPNTPHVESITVLEADSVR